MYRTLIWMSKTISGLSKGIVTDYALYILIGVCFYLYIFSFNSNILDSVSCIIISSTIILILIYPYLGISENSRKISF
jgi:hypothetical protein